MTPRAARATAETVKLGKKTPSTAAEPNESRDRPPTIAAR
jgi:hypothetical protein